MSGVQDVLVDSTSEAIIRMAKDKTPDRAAINEAIKRFGMEVTTLEEIERNKPKAIFEASITGFG